MLKVSFPQLVTVELLLLALLGTFGSATAFAYEWEKKEAGDNILLVQGECKDDVTVYLYPQNANTVLYSAGASCKKGRFYLKDDLSIWKIPLGDYRIIVSEKQKPKSWDLHQIISKVEKKLFASQSSRAHTAGNGNSNVLGSSTEPTEIDSFQANLFSLASLVETLKSSLIDSNYPEPLKSTIMPAIETIELSITTITKLLNPDISTPSPTAETTATPLPSATPASTEIPALEATPSAVPSEVATPSATTTVNEESGASAPTGASPVEIVYPHNSE